MTSNTQNKTDALVIKEAILFPVLDTRKERRVDISSLILEFTISESITSNTINMTCLIVDKIGLLEEYPLRGEERVLFTVFDFTGNIKTYDLFLYRVNNVTPTDESDGIIYNAYFVSYQHFLASTQKLIRPFKEKKVVELIEGLFNEFYVGTKKLQIGEEQLVSDDLTDNQISGTFPNITVPQAIEFLVRRSYSTKRKTSSFRFFENTDSFFFISDEGLEEYAKSANKIFDLTSTRVPIDPEYFEQHKNNLEKISNTERFNTFEDMFGGYYKNVVLEIDTLKKTFNERTYDYLESGNSYFNAGPFRRIVDRHTREFVEEYFTEENAKKFYLVKDYMDIDAIDGTTLAGNRFYPEMIGNRHAFRSHLNSVKVDALGPCRLDICAGSIVNLEILKFNANSNKKETNEQLTGKYIVKTVSRVMKGDISKNQYVLIKRDWNNTEFTRSYGGGR